MTQQALIQKYQLQFSDVDNNSINYYRNTNTYKIWIKMFNLNKQTTEY